MDSSGWTDGISAGASVLALVVSAFSFAIAMKAQRLSEAQERRRSPQLHASLLDSKVTRDLEGHRQYAFHLTLRNPSDSDNAVERIELHIRYAVGAAEMTLKLEALAGRREGHDVNLTSPVSVGSHQAARGWVVFDLPASLAPPHGATAYRVVLTDIHGTEIVVEPLLLSEDRDVA